MKRIAIVGCRPPPGPSTPEQRALYSRICADVLAFVHSLSLSSCVVSGGARGVDVEACDAARYLGLTVEEHLPDYAAYGGRAPLERNTILVREADEIHAWPAPWSRGTWDTIRKARAAGKPCVVHEVKP